MEEFPSQSHKARESRDIQPITTNPGKVRQAPAGRRFLNTIFLGDAKSALSGMIWDTFFPNLRDNFMDAMHDGIDTLFGGSSGGYRPGHRTSRRGSSISKHNPDRALGGMSERERYSKEDRSRQSIGVIELDSRAEASAVLEQMNLLIDKYDVVRLAEFYEMVRITPTHADYKWGWEDLGGASIGHSRGVYFLDLPEPIVLR